MSAAPELPAGTTPSRQQTKADVIGCIVTKRETRGGIRIIGRWEREALRFVFGCLYHSFP